MAELNEKEMEEVGGGVSPFVSYTIVFGDTLSEIALRTGTTVSFLAQLNNIPNPDVIRAGQVILVPRGKLVY